MATISIKRTETGELTAFDGDRNLGREVNARSLSTPAPVVSDLTSKFGTAVTHAVEDVTASVASTVTPVAEPAKLEV